MNEQLQGYVEALSESLKLDPADKEQVVSEIATHLCERARELQEAGLPEAVAVAQAVREMGDPRLLARQFYSVHSKAGWRDILLASLPHLVLSGMFALHLWTESAVLLVAVALVALVSLRVWRGSKPRWTYPWLGYTLFAAGLSWLLSLSAVGYGSWILFRTGNLPFSIPLFIVLAGSVPFLLWLTWNVAVRVMRQDWLLASLTALPLPFLLTWLLLMQWEGGILTYTGVTQESDGARALVFLALAVTTAVFFRLGHRILQVGLLTTSSVVLTVYMLRALPLGPGGLAGILLVLATVALLLSPAVLQSRLFRRHAHHHPVVGEERVVNHWFASAP